MNEKLTGEKRSVLARLEDLEDISPDEFKREISRLADLGDQGVMNKIFKAYLKKQQISNQLVHAKSLTAFDNGELPEIPKMETEEELLHRVQLDLDRVARFADAGRRGLSGIFAYNYILNTTNKFEVGAIQKFYRDAVGFHPDNVAIFPGKPRK